MEKISLDITIGEMSIDFDPILFSKIAIPKHEIVQSFLSLELNHENMIYHAFKFVMLDELNSSQIKFSWEDSLDKDILKFIMKHSYTYDIVYNDIYDCYIHDDFNLWIFRADQVDATVNILMEKDKAVEFKLRWSNNTNSYYQK